MKNSLLKAQLNQDFQPNDDIAMKVGIKYNELRAIIELFPFESDIEIIIKLDGKIFLAQHGGTIIPGKMTKEPTFVKIGWVE